MRLLINSTQLVKFHYSCKLWKFLLVYRSPNKFQTTRFFGHLRSRQFNLIRLILVSIRTFSVSQYFQQKNNFLREKCGWLKVTYGPITQNTNFTGGGFEKISFYLSVFTLRVNYKRTFVNKFLKCTSSGTKKSGYLRS